MRTRLLLGLWILSGCASSATPELLNAGPYTGAPGGQVGATVGGQKDLAQVRATVLAGGVPSASMIVTEGLLAEHDFQTEGEPCTERFCARPAVARAKSLTTGKDELFVHVGLLANLGADWKRPPADLVLVVDKGLSMTIDLADVATAINVLIDKLRPDDRLAVVVFDDVARTLIPFGPVTDKESAKGKVRALGAGGGFQVMDGLDLGFATADEARSEGRMSRVMLFTCGYPPGGPGPFADLVKKYAARGVGLSIFGVLLSFDTSIGHLMSTEYGGNFFFLDSLAKVQKVFDTDLDFVITPIAYDFKLAVIPAPTVGVAKAWGIPGDTLKLEATTLFPSRNKGAIVLRLDAPPELAPEASGSFEFQYTTAVGATPLSESSPLLRATHTGVRKAAALVNEADVLVEALTQWEAGQRAEPRAKLDALVTYVQGEAAVLHDPQFDAEVTFVTKLRANMH